MFDEKAVRCYTKPDKPGCSLKVYTSGFEGVLNENNVSAVVLRELVSVSTGRADSMEYLTYCLYVYVRKRARVKGEWKRKSIIQLNLISLLKFRQNGFPAGSITGGIFTVSVVGGREGGKF